MNKFTNYLINESESKSKQEYDTVNKAIVFIDIVGSSLLWKEDEREMFNTLILLEEKVFELIEDSENGMVIKTIGDAYMITFDSLIDSIKFSTSLIEYIKTQKVNDKELQTRTGIAYGSVYIREQTIQNNKVLDFFGNTVNTASRMESNVSEINGIAFSYESITENEKRGLKGYIEENFVSEVIDFNDDCKKIKHKRSARLLSDIQISCESISKLKGIENTVAYKIISK